MPKQTSIKKFCLYLHTRWEIRNFAKPIMNILNPYEGVEHKVYKRTFLQSTEVKVEFEPKMTSADFTARIVPFVSKAFNKNISEYLDKSFEQIELSSNNSPIRFVFNLNSACVVVGSSAYKSFSSSVVPYIRVLISYLNEVACTERIKHTYINKVNVWPIKSKDSRKAFGNASLFIFKKEHVEDIANLKFNEPDYPVSATKEAVVKCGEKAILKAKMGVELKDVNETRFILELRAQTSNIGVGDLISDLLKLNDIIFGAFTDIVSPNIFDLMSKDE